MLKFKSYKSCSRHDSRDMIMSKKTKCRKILYCLGLVSCLFCSNYAKGQVTNQIVVEADSLVQLEQTFKLRYQYNTNNSTEKLISPIWDWGNDKDGFAVISGPMRSTQTSTTIKNNKTTKTYGESYTFILSFNKEGNYSMPIMKAQTNSGVELTSKPFTVHATKETVLSLSNSSTKSTKNDLLAVEATVNKNHITLGDSVECEIRVYTNLSLDQLSSPPLAINSAYWKEQTLPSKKTYENVYYKGKYVPSLLWKKMTIIPMQAGDFRIEPMKIKATWSKLNSNDPLLFFKPETFIYLDSIITTSPITIHVKEQQLPATNIVLSNKKNTHTSGLVIDRSSSLKAQSDSLAPTYFQLENHFLEQLINKNVLSDYSITLFAGKPHYPKSENTSAILNSFPSKGNDGSAIYDAILASALRDGVLTREHAPYSILLLSDGSDNKSKLSEKTLTNLLLKHRIRVDVIAFASKKDSIYYAFDDTIEYSKSKIKNTQNFSNLQRIAKNTNGAFILIENKSQIPAAIRKIKEKRLKSEVPNQQPEKGFHPQKTILYTLYKEIMMEAESEF